MPSSDFKHQPYHSALFKFCAKNVPPHIVTILAHYIATNVGRTVAKPQRDIEFDEI